jgi:hypothetical protein
LLSIAFSPSSALRFNQTAQWFMAIINYANGEIHFKILYYGPGLCGKTTSLTYVHARLSSAYRSELVTFAAAADATLFFDLLPVDALLLQGLKTRFQLYTSPARSSTNPSASWFCAASMAPYLSLIRNGTKWRRTSRISVTSNKTWQSST